MVHRSSIVKYPIVSFCISNPQRHHHILLFADGELTGDFARIIDAIEADYTGKIVRSNVWFLRREAPRDQTEDREPANSPFLRRGAPQERSGSGALRSNVDCNPMLGVTRGRNGHQQSDHERKPNLLYPTTHVPKPAKRNSFTDSAW